MKTNKKKRKNVPSPAVNIKVQVCLLKSMDLIVLQPIDIANVNIYNYEEKV